MRSSSILDHTADVMIEGRGDTLEEAFEGIAIALQSVITDTSRIYEKKKLKECIDLKSDKWEDWLFEFLNKIIFIKDTEKIVFKDIKVEISERSYGKELCFEIKGDKINFKKYEINVDVKGASYSNLEVIKERNYYICRCIVDV
ncbi:MAG: archease [Brevinematia bacterium]